MSKQLNYTPGPVDRETVYEVTDGERLYQDAGAGNAARTSHPGAADGPLTVGEGIACLEELIGKARAAWYVPGGVPAALDQLRKVTAVAVQLQECYGVVYRDHEVTAAAQRAQTDDEIPF